MFFARTTNCTLISGDRFQYQEASVDEEEVYDEANGDEHDEEQ